MLTGDQEQQTQGNLKAEKGEFKSSIADGTLPIPSAERLHGKLESALGMLTGDEQKQTQGNLKAEKAEWTKGWSNERMNEWKSCKNQFCTVLIQNKVSRIQTGREENGMRMCDQAEREVSATRTAGMNQLAKEKRSSLSSLAKFPIADKSACK